MKMKFKDKYFSFCGKKYALNLDKLKEVCLTSSKDGVNKEYEIAQTYELNDSGELEISNKVEHETKIYGNQQNDMIIYDVVKVLVIALLENNQDEDSFTMDFGTCLTMNTLINWKILVEVE